MGLAPRASTCPAPAPDFGPGVAVFSPDMPMPDIQREIDSIYSRQESNEFGSGRHALLFLPGTYDLDVRTGFYTQVLGLGAKPTDVTITGAGVNSYAHWDGGNATRNFWRGAENLTMAPASGVTTWAVSQAAPLRRVLVRGSVVLHDGGYSSGGFLADSRVTGTVTSGSQQQWLSRNDKFGRWHGANWNMVFVGVTGAPRQSFPNPPYTTIGRAPVSVEKPFLHLTPAGAYEVFVPAPRANSVGTGWSGASEAGTSVPVSQFFVARPGDSAAIINSALASGMDLLVTPGVYYLSSAIHVTRPGTVVLGLGLATLVAPAGGPALTVADVDGVRLAGLMVDAGPANSPVLIEVGPPGSQARHVSDPTVLSDIFARVGGPGVGKATQTLVINSNDVIGDNLWLWRADHGNGVGWDANTAAHGLVVNGSGVSVYGLAVEHYQREQVVWHGNDGRVWFFQSEMPYDPPDQAAWKDGDANGYPSFLVAESVASFHGYGLGSYCFFQVDPSVHAANAFVVPTTPSVALQGLVTVSLGGVGTIDRIVNGSGAPADPATSVACLSSYPWGSPSWL